MNVSSTWLRMRRAVVPDGDRPAQAHDETTHYGSKGRCPRAALPARLIRQIARKPYASLPASDGHTYRFMNSVINALSS